MFNSLKKKLRNYFLRETLENQNQFNEFIELLSRNQNFLDKYNDHIGESVSGKDNLKNREYWLENTIKQIPSGLKILDAGAGELQYKKFCSHLEYVSQDLGEYDGQGDNIGLHTSKWDNSKLDIKSDIINIPVEDNSFDAIMCVEVFEHITEPALAVKEFSRIIKPGGKLIVTAPFCSITHFAPFYYSNGYSPYWYKEVLAKYNFKPLEIVPNGSYFQYMAQQIRRTPFVIEEFSKQNISEFEKLAYEIVLKTLDKAVEADTNSSDLLCYGYHVLAEKL